MAELTSSLEALTSAEIGTDRDAIDRALSQLCASELAAVIETAPHVAEAIRYSLLGGGKRFRGVLLLATYRAAGGQGDASGLAAAIEVVHAYSLVHDDLPCMDDDNVRRGRATTHLVFGVPVATVAGVAMVPLAARAAANAARSLGLGPPQLQRVVGDLMAAAGGGGMIGGQLLDLGAEGKPLTVSEMEYIHRAKTGALITACARLGGVAARAEEAALAALGHYGAALGLAFQIADDVLDVTATTDVLGKTAGRDAALRKSTYPSLLGVEGARERATSLIDGGCDALRRAGLLTPLLDGIAQFVVRRTS